MFWFFKKRKRQQVFVSAAHNHKPLKVLPPTELPEWYIHLKKGSVFETHPEAIIDEEPKEINNPFEALGVNKDFFPMAPTSLETFQKLNSSDVSPQQFSAIIMKEPTLVGPILKEANSAHYGFHFEVQTVERAVVLLGYNTIKSLVLNQALNEAFPQDDLHQDVLTYSKFVSKALELLALEKPTLNRELLSSLGMLQGIGLLLAQEFQEESGEHPTLSPQELHAHLNLAFCEVWNLPQEFASILSHLPYANSYPNQYFPTGAKQNLAALNTACELANWLGFSYEATPKIPSTDCLELLQLSPEPHTWLSQEAFLEIDALFEVPGIDGDFFESDTHFKLPG